jgi:hypothetical protein
VGPLGCNLRTCGLPFPETPLHLNPLLYSPLFVTLFPISTNNGRIAPPFTAGFDFLPPLIALSLLK